LALALGFHWALLQTVAWTGMVISYSQRASLHEAIAKTFDGKHPCALCNAIQKGRAEEQKRDHQQLNPSVKLDFAVVWQGNDFIFSTVREAIPSPDPCYSARHEAPPKPRPRLA
jgi:hypothetical protein